MLYFIQQFSIKVVLTSKMLYSVQDFQSKKKARRTNPLAFHHPRIRGSLCIVHMTVLSCGLTSAD